MKARWAGRLVPSGEKEEMKAQSESSVGWATGAKACDRDLGWRLGDLSGRDTVISLVDKEGNWNTVCLVFLSGSATRQREALLLAFLAVCPL